MINLAPKPKYSPSSIINMGAVGTRLPGSQRPLADCVVPGPPLKHLLSPSPSQALITHGEITARGSVYLVVSVRPVITQGPVEGDGLDSSKSWGPVI